MKMVFVDFRISSVERINLERLGLEVLSVPPCKVLYEAICGHPDILLHILDNRTILLHKDMDINFINKLKEQGIDVFLSNNSLESNYPGDIILNAVSVNNILLHSLKNSDSRLLELSKGRKFLNTKQGYTKCSTAIITENAVITSDVGIANILIDEKFDVLIVPPGDICLPGLDYGFIGGTCGLIDNNTIAFYGNLETYKYGNEVRKFLTKHHIEPIYLSDGNLIDRGSLLVIQSNN